MTTLLLARLQFAFTISVHILFPAFSIGLATFIAVLEGVYLWRKDPFYLNLCQFWTKVFALTFGMGVVSGIVMEFQLGTNWSVMTKAVGDVLGVLFTYEVLTAFFIEAGFLGVMLFGWNRVGPKLHYLATLLVTLGVTLSAFWILSANSWMQTPSGASYSLGHFSVTNWSEVVFNPSALTRFLHMMLAAYISTLFAISGISAFYLLKGQHIPFAKTCLSYAFWGLIILVPLQILVGDRVGLIIHLYQPIKTAAMEGLWHTQNGAPLLLFAIPDMAKQTNLFPIAIPHLASLINTHQWNGSLQGLTSATPADQPYVPLTFFSFRLMAGLGGIMLLLAIIGIILYWRRRLFTTRWFLRLCLYCSPIGFIALWAGWITAETGRQPWVIYHFLRTSDVASPILLKNVVISFALILIVYGLIFGIFYFRYFFKLLHKGPSTLTKEAMPFAYMPGQAPIIDKETP